MNSLATTKDKVLKEVDYVNSRVRTTKQEIEQLKNELEKLIHSGTKPSQLPADCEKKPPQTVNIANGKHVEVRSLERPAKKTVPVAQKKTEPAKPSLSKKARNYNVNEARDFIKKQKEKRAEQLKAQIKGVDNKLDLKKQKLKELHQKTIELVNKNVQLKRERSQSRDHEPPMRLDRSNVKKIPERANANTRLNIPSKSQERKKPIPSTTARSRSQVADNAKNREKIQQPNVKIPITENSERVSRPRARNKFAAVSVPSMRPTKLDPNFLCPPEKLRSTTTNQIELEKTFIPDVDLSFQDIPAEPVDLNQRIPFEPDLAPKDSVDDVPVLEKKRPKKRKKLLEHAIMTDACVKETKETQTSRGNGFEGAPWMQPPPSLPYPYNFINTVKRKLQHAINSPSCVDVGVQKSDNPVQTPQVERVNSRQEIKEMLIKSAQSEMRSFASHKCPNLDLKVVENLELIPNNVSGKGKSSQPVSKNLFTNYDSESDTSKNIPEISSESLGSVNSKPRLSLDKLKDLKLQKLSKSLSDSNIRTDTNNGYPEREHDSYSFDFQKESINNSTKSSGKSETTTIRTVVSDKIVSNLVIPSDASLVDDSSTFTNYCASGISKHVRQHNRKNISEHPELQSFTKFINTSLRGDDNSQPVFRSLLTESQISKTRSGLSTEISFSKPISESLALKEPPVSLSIRKRKSPDVILMDTITIRPHFEDRTVKRTDGGAESQGSFKSLLTRDKISKSGTESISDNLGGDAVSKTISVSVGQVGSSMGLKEPSLVLVLGKDQKRDDVVKSQMKNITLRPSSQNNNVNEIHLKFEAEVRLLNDFNESFKQFIATEKAFETLKTKNESNLAMTKMLQNVDTQTSFMSKTSTNVTTEKSIKDTRGSTSLINFSRGSGVMEELDDVVANNNLSSTLKSLQNSTFSTDWNVSNLNESSHTTVSTGDEGRSRLSISNIENYDVKNCATYHLLSLNIFDQLIKDEDTRIQQLKAIIKIREHALLDRTKSELLWLDIQKKQLLETGKIEEASLLKKKQRGIILKREQERNEIKKLKQMQKEVSERRKNTLKQQRNLIKTQLSTDNMLSKITVKKRKERRSTGPLRVVQSCSESIHSEASISLKSSGIEDILNITSKSLRVSEDSEVDFSRKLKDEDVQVTSAKRTLLMREAALQKRRKAAEELLTWHRKLLEEERKISELEAAATSVVKRAPEEPRDKTNRKEPKQRWKSMTGSDEKVYVMSQLALERLCKSAGQYSNKSKKTPTKTSEPSTESEGEKSARRSSDDNYSSAFETESVQEIINSQEEKTKISSISELIDNFSRIEDEISILGKKSEDIVSLKEDQSSQSRVETMTPNHVEEVPTVETSDESEKTVPEDTEISSGRETIEEEPSIIEVIEGSEAKVDESIKDTSPPQEDIEEPTIGLPHEDIKSISTEDQEVPEFVSSTNLEGSKSAQEFSEIPTETRDDSEQIKSSPEGSFSPESHKVTTESQKIDSEEAKSALEVSSHGISHQQTEDSVASEVSVSLEGEKITTDERIEGSRSPLASIVTEVPEASSEKDKELEDISDKSLDGSSSSSEDQDRLLRGSFIPSVRELEEVSEEVVSKDERSEKLPILEDHKERTWEKIDDVVEDQYETSESLHTQSREERTIESPSRDIDVEKELLALDEALESASKIEESLNKLNEQLSSEKKDEISEDISSTKDVESIAEEAPSKSTSKSDSSVHGTGDKTPSKKSTNQIDVKKRVSEILADVSPSRGDKSPRLQDLYITAYDVGATNPPEINESSCEDGRQLPTDIFGIEAEELWKKQLAIEQEIKQIELQQKEQLPFVFMREIPNKPPPPYTPPSSLSSLPPSILPTDVKELSELASYSSKVLYKAYENKNLDKVKFSEQGFKLFSKVEVTKMCAEYVFNICRDLAKDHYKQFETVQEPSWLALPKRPQLTKTKPSDAVGLERILSQKLKELFGFRKVQVAESAIIKWGRKKRDHVDEVLVIESQEEESQWINFDKDELIMKNQVTDDIMKMLLEETATVFAKILSKKNRLRVDV